ncbi:MAG: HAMP domain-containing protein [Elusimicrobia bacterium]|nr:HAMP domain-containing protein [Elusimicrobiota bacterium]
MEQKPKYKRRIVIVKRALQFKYITIVIVAMLLVAFTVGWDVYYTVGRAIIDLNHPELFPLMVKINNLMLGKLVVLIVVVFIISIFVSHKFAGPIFRFEKSCDTIAEGDLTHRVHLRAGDELMELQERFNNMVESIQKGVSDNKELSKVTAEKLAAISSQFSQQNISSADLSEISRQLTKVASDLSKISSNFKV